MMLPQTGGNDSGMLFVFINRTKSTRNVMLLLCALAHARKHRHTNKHAAHVLYLGISRRRAVRPLVDDDDATTSSELIA